MDGDWKLVTDERMIELLKAGVPVTATAVPSGGVCGTFTSNALLRARDVELDVGVTARALSFLDCISLSRSEAVSKTFRHDISRIAWNDLANQLSREVKDRAKKRLTVQAAETIRSKDMVIYAQKEKIASDYAEKIANIMSPEEFAEKGQLLSELHPSKEDYDIYIRFSLDDYDRVLCQGFFEVVNNDAKSLHEHFGDFSKYNSTINLDNANLSQWPEIEAFLERTNLPSLTTEDEDEVEEAFDELKPEHIAFTVVAIHKRSLQPSVLFFDNAPTSKDGTRSWACNFWDVERRNMHADVNMVMYFDAFHEGEIDLNAEDGPVESVFHSPLGDVRQLVQGNLSLQPANPNRISIGWKRFCSLRFDRPGSWRMEFDDVLD